MLETIHDLKYQLQKVQVTLESVQGDFNVPHFTDAKLYSQVKNSAEELRVLKESAFLTEGAHQAFLSCLHKQLDELGEQEVLGRKV